MSSIGRPASRDVPFDRVVVKDDGVRNEYSVDAFLALPLYQRVAYILERKIEFFAGERMVDRANALRSLRSQSALIP